MYNRSFFMQNRKNSITMSQAISGRSQLRAMIVPAFATTIFGGVWLFIAVSALHNSEAVVIVFRILVGILTVVLLIASIRFARDARHAATGPSPLADRQKLMIYIGAVVFEVAAYIIGYNILESIHRLDLVVPLLAFVVGLHFLGLIPVFQTKRYIPIALVFCLTAIIAIFLPYATPREGNLINIRVLAVGLVCGLYLWYVTSRLLMQGRRFVRE